MLRRQLERHGRWLIAIAALAVVAVASITYVLMQQRVTTPLADRYVVRVELATTAGLEPGLGQPANVAGVRVGTIVDVELDEGRSLVKLEIDPKHLPRVYQNAQAALVPNTPIKDLQVELVPGGPPARALPDGGVIPIARTVPPVDLDELTAALDRDTRDFFEVLVAGADQGTRRRGRDFRAALRALAPTAAQLGEVEEELAARRRALRRVVHNLALLTRAGAAKDGELAQVVEHASATVGALADEERALRGSIARLPGTLQAARGFVRETEFMRDLRPTLDALLPAVRRLPAALRAADPLVTQGEPFLRRELRPLVREIQPLARDLAPTARDLNAVTPHLTGAFKVVRYLANELGHNPEGEDEGYLFWLAWFAHNNNSVVSTQDAHGVVFRGFDIVDCDNVQQQPPLVELLTLVTTPLPAC